jgi:hypothetical protein
VSEQSTGLAKLREPFAPSQISKLPRVTCGACRDLARKGKPWDTCPRHNYEPCSECGGRHTTGAMHLDYVGHAALTDRLLEVDPAWQWEPVAYDEGGLPRFDREGGLWIRLTVCGVTRLGYGDAQGKTGPNAVKEAIGDGLRNSAMRFGAALDLWHKGDLHGDADSPPVADGRQTSAPPEVAALKREVVSAGKHIGLDDVAALSQDYAQRHNGLALGAADADALGEYLDELRRASDALDGAATEQVSADG